MIPVYVGLVPDGVSLMYEHACLMPEAVSLIHGHVGLMPE